MKEPKTMSNTFVCENCRKEVATDGQIGTKNRNHCPSCLFSKHVDNLPGDRGAACGGLMQPIGLTLKQEGVDKYGEEKIGELMLIHRCKKDNKISINRIAADDAPEKILQILENSKNLSEDIQNELKKQGIKLLTDSDKAQISTLLFGKTN